MKKAIQWFIVVSGIYDLAIGLGMILATLSSAVGQPATWTLSMMTGGFLAFCGAALIWAAQDVPSRGSVIFWQGLLRLFAVAVIFHAVSKAYTAPAEANSSIIAAIIDLVTATIYGIGLLFAWRLSLPRLLLGRRIAEP